MVIIIELIYLRNLKNHFRLAKLEVSETYENSRHFDLTFMICVWLAFVPTVTTPLLFVAWNSDR